MPNGVRHLPFQFQQRGPELAEKVADPKSLARYLEQRDQDLENYLANLGGGATVSAALLYDATLPDTKSLTFSGPAVLTPVQAFGNLAIESGELVYVGPNDPDGVFAIAVAQTQWLTTLGGTPGFLVVDTVLGSNGTDTQVLVPNTGAMTINQQATTLGSVTGILAALALDSLMFGGAGAQNMDLTTSSGALGVPTDIIWQAASLLIYAVE